MIEFNLKIIVLILSILCTGLTAGLCFTWSNAVTPGLGKLDDLEYLKAFQEINRSIINIRFLMIFFSPVLLLYFNLILHKDENPITINVFLTAAIVFTIGIGFTTIIKNIPLNEMLDKTNLESLTINEIKQTRAAFETPWNRWHFLRTTTSLFSFLILLIGAFYSK